MADPQMQAGQQISPTIRLVRPLGQGSMGNVWAAEHLTLGTPVAVKLMATGYSQQPEFVARFRQEAQAAAQIRSPHVAQVLDYGMTSEGAPFIVMELLEGETLQQALQRRGSLPLPEVIRIVGHTANALTRAHRLGVVHRDIKPDNLFLIDVEGEAFLKVLDFGIAKLIQPEELGMTSTSRLLGTPLYMSPEQLVSAKRVDHRTDLWSLAVVAFQALTGKLPYTGETIGAMAVAVHTGAFPPPRSLRPDLPAAIDEWMARALQRDPAARFGSALEMSEALERAAGLAPPRPSTAGVLVDARREAREAIEAIEETVVAPPPPPRGERPRPEPTAAAPRHLSPLEIRVGASRVLLTRGNIVEAKAEAIVSPADATKYRNLDAVADAIRRAAGWKARHMPEILDGCPVGSAVVTPVTRLPHPIRFVIHAVAPEYSVVRAAECDGLLRSTYDACLRLAESSRVRSVAFPALGTGAGGFLARKAAPIALAATIEYLAGAARSVELILFVLPTDSTYTAFAKALASRPLS